MILFYGRCRKLPYLNGQALHAYKLGLIHPIKGSERLLAKMPPELEKLISVIRKKLKYLRTSYQLSGSFMTDSEKFSRRSDSTIIPFS